MMKAQVGLQRARMVTQIQDEELNRIGKSCIEHAVISLATAFETYYKEFLQQLLFIRPGFFLSKNYKILKFNTGINPPSTTILLRRY
jgi:hypothetical protein